jgi:hypothetical protein
VEKLVQADNSKDGKALENSLVKGPIIEIEVLAWQAKS